MKIQGFTLLETLVYIALFGVLMSGALLAVYELLVSSENNRSFVAVQEEGVFINRKLSWALGGATEVELIGTTTIAITQPALGSQSPLQFDIQDKKIYLKRGDAPWVPLVGDEFLVTDVSFTVAPPQGGLPTLVRMRYRINDVPFSFTTYLHF